MKKRRAILKGPWKQRRKQQDLEDLARLALGARNVARVWVARHGVFVELPRGEVGVGLVRVGE